MAKYDIQILPDRQGVVEFQVMGKSADTGLMLLQRLYALLFSTQTEQYRGGAFGYDLMMFLEGGNRPSDPMLTSMLGISCTAAVQALDPEDRALVQAFTAQSVDGDIFCTLTLTDGTRITGAI